MVTSQQPFEGVIGKSFADSKPWWPPLDRAPEGSPNVVMVLLDDVGYAQFGCYGSDIDTPTFDRMAAGGSPSTEPKLPCPSMSGTRIEKSWAMRTIAS